MCRGVALKALCVSATAFELGPTRQDPAGFASLVQLLKLVVAGVCVYMRTCAPGAGGRGRVYACTQCLSAQDPCDSALSKQLLELACRACMCMHVRACAFMHVCLELCMGKGGGGERAGKDGRGDCAQVCAASFGWRVRVCACVHTSMDVCVCGCVCMCVGVCVRV